MDAPMAATFSGIDTSPAFEDTAADRWSRRSVPNWMWTGEVTYCPCQNWAKRTAMTPPNRKPGWIATRNPANLLDRPTGQSQFDCLIEIEGVKHD